MNIHNTILWGNTETSLYELWIQNQSMVSISYSDVEDGQSAAYIDGTSTLTWGDGMIDADPLFVDADGPDDNPYTWEDNVFHLLATSPCIDVGDNTVAELPAKDFEGDPRCVKGLAPGAGLNLFPMHSAPQLPAVDMGADEYCTMERVHKRTL